jgi:polar amino acid transport system substrate-binding protein
LYLICEFGRAKLLHSVVLMVLPFPLQHQIHRQNDMFKFFVCLFIIILAAVPAGAADLRLIAPRNQAMPLVRIEAGKLTGGILKELGDALAARTGRRAVFVTVDGDQVAAALQAGKADGICYVRPFWIDGDYHWSQPLIPDAELLAAHPAAPRLRSLHDLRDRPVGTVAGYRYPRLEQVLGLRFQRHDAPTMEDNLRQIAAGKVRYAVLGQSTLAWQQKGGPALRLRADLVFASYTAQCAFSRRTQVPFPELERAIGALVADGSVGAILARYR